MGSAVPAARPRYLVYSVAALLACANLATGQSNTRRIPDLLYTPNSPILDSHGDALALKAAGVDLRYIRWLSRYNATTGAELTTQQILSAFVANSLNLRYRALGPLVPVGAGGRTLRVDLKALGIDPAVWDRLGLEGSGTAPFPEPFFNEQLQQAANQAANAVETYTERAYWPGGTHTDGRHYPAGWYTETRTRPAKAATRKTVLAPARWVDRAKALELIALTHAALVPVYRADWAITYLLQPPFYQHALGDPKDFGDFLKLAGVDRKAFDREAVTLRGAVLRSEVAHHNRALERTPTDTNYGRGYFHQSFDFRTSILQQDVYRNLLQRVRDAGELIWALPNGLQGYGVVALQGGKELALDAVDSKIAADRRGKFHDPTIYNGWRCVGCHSQGIIPVADEVRLTARPPKGLAVPDPHEAKRIADLYFGEDFNRLVQDDQRNYAAAVRALTGLDPAAVSLAFSEAAWRYLDQPLTLEDAAVEAGYPLETLFTAIALFGEGGQVDHPFLRMAMGRPARRDQFEAAFSTLEQYLVLLKERKP